MSSGFMSEEDQEIFATYITLPSIMVALFGGSIGGMIAWINTKGLIATAWLMEHQILVPKEEAMITFLDAGLDLARIILILAVFILLIWAIVAGARRSRLRRA